MMKNALLLLALSFLVLPAFAESTKEKESAAGKQYGTSATQKLAFHGATPVAERANAAQAVVTLTTGAALATTAPTQTTPYGFASSAQAAALTTRINTLIADNIALAALVNELRAALVEKGLITGAAP